MADIVHDRFKLLKKLGAGGSGEVFQAKDLKLNRLVAVKRVTTKDPDRRERLLRRLHKEAESLAAIEHPNVVVVHDIVEWESSVNIIMELVTGTPLLSKIRKKALSESEYLPLFRQMILALEAVHEFGLVHRDLNPKNVLVTKQGIVKLVDFGLSAKLDDERPRVGGTLGYMPPESMRRSGRLTFGVDIYSLGFLSYQALLGIARFKKFYGTPNPKEWMRFVLSREPFKPLSELDPKIFRGLSMIIAKMLEKEIDQRYKRITQVREDLDVYIESRNSFNASEPARIPKRESKRA